MINIYFALATLLLFLYAIGAFHMITTTSVWPAVDIEVNKGPFVEETTRHLRFQKGPISFYIGSYYKRQPTNYGPSNDGNGSAVSSSRVAI
ncbi:hypothetical protein OIDMADRAFT_16492 [Oidiodendron maius Zn]|uniref:Uncharacterized protein n=1 Tax=Oidiodendron maius (strain Zn) TaxID=913774 RepID=A0A0C3HZ62_OIDMZ|nr:hypothetical protein OIDMADRAFT_16492 [Oidiodendron maius Zn]